VTRRDGYHGSDQPTPPRPVGPGGSSHITDNAWYIHGYADGQRDERERANRRTQEDETAHNKTFLRGYDAGQESVLDTLEEMGIVSAKVRERLEMRPESAS
jgi:hypothetical protein